MRHGFIKVGAATPLIRVADCVYNAGNIVGLMGDAAKSGVKLLAFPELCLTGYTCSDLFLQRTLLDGARQALKTITEESTGLDMAVVVGLPLAVGGKLYNCAAVIHEGRVLGVVPKTHIPNYNEYYEVRHFTAAPEKNGTIAVNGQDVPFGRNLIFSCDTLASFSFAVEICEDLWVPCAPSVSHACAGATVIVNPSAGDEVVGKAEYRRSLVEGQSARLVCGYLYAGAGEGESSTDMVFSGHGMVCENGVLLRQAGRFENSLIITELDTDRLEGERRRMTTFPKCAPDGYDFVPFRLKTCETVLTREISPSPFVPSGRDDRSARCEEIFSIQSMGLKKRIEHTSSKSVIVGVSGGLDSTLALLVTARAIDLLKRPRTDVIAVTMPCFGTTDRTHDNAVKLANLLGATLKEINVSEAVTLHFKDIGQNPDNHDVTYENSQARERTQVLMDIANLTGGLVVGTGDLSELALGWATYNGDHMSMYGVNASVPKTLVRYLISYVAELEPYRALSGVLNDVLDTPVSPELIPAVNGEISQKTEDIIGPYQLHDFFLYYAIRWAFPPSKVYRLAQKALGGSYSDAEILKWLKNFYKRFFAQQFKRSCLPDGPKVGSVTLSPRGDWRMPSDARPDLWLAELEQL